MHDRKPPWWRGERGEWFVVGQFALMLLVVFGPRAIGGFGGATLPAASLRRAAGWVLIAAAGAVAFAARRHLGRNLTPLPYPRAGGHFVDTGPYAFVRHPMYSALILGSIGIALLARGWLTFVYAGALFALLDVKSRREDRWLVQRLPEYRDYRRRVRRLVPFVY